MKYLLLFFVFIPTYLFAEKVEPKPYCTKVLPEAMFQTLFGTFEVIGKNSHGVAYSGQLKITLIGNAYKLTKTLDYNKMTGEAWVESCGPDKFQRLVVKYQQDSGSSTFTCYLSGDGDNFLRSSCKSLDNRSLEAWFQSNDIMS